jgi:hypothetical protein
VIERGTVDVSVAQRDAVERYVQARGWDVSS